MLYASTATQLRRLAIGSAGQVLQITGGIPAWSNTLTAKTFSGDITLGANRLITTNLLLKEVSTTALGILNAADTAYRNLMLDTVRVQSSISMEANGAPIDGWNGDNFYVLIRARDNGVGLVEVARFQGAADPEFQIGDNGNALRGSYGGLLGFFATAPQAKPTGVAVTAAGIHAALVTLGLIAS